MLRAFLLRGRTGRLCKAPLRRFLGDHIPSKVHKGMTARFIGAKLEKFQGKRLEKQRLKEFLVSSGAGDRLHEWNIRKPLARVYITMGEFDNALATIDTAPLSQADARDLFKSCLSQPRGNKSEVELARWLVKFFEKRRFSLSRVLLGRVLVVLGKAGLFDEQEKVLDKFKHQKIPVSLGIELLKQCRDSPNGRVRAKKIFAQSYDVDSMLLSVMLSLFEDDLETQDKLIERHLKMMNEVCFCFAFTSCRALIGPAREKRIDKLLNLMQFHQISFTPRLLEDLLFASEDNWGRQDLFVRRYEAMVSPKHITSLLRGCVEKPGGVERLETFLAKFKHIALGREQQHFAGLVYQEANEWEKHDEFRKRYAPSPGVYDIIARYLWRRADPTKRAKELYEEMKDVGVAPIPSCAMALLKHFIEGSEWELAEHVKKGVSSMDDITLHLPLIGLSAVQDVDERVARAESLMEWFIAKGGRVAETELARLLDICGEKWDKQDKWVRRFKADREVCTASCYEVLLKHCLLQNEEAKERANRIWRDLTDSGAPLDLNVVTTRLKTLRAPRMTELELEDQGLSKEEQNFFDTHQHLPFINFSLLAARPDLKYAVEMAEDLLSASGAALTLAEFEIILVAFGRHGQWSKQDYAMQCYPQFQRSRTVFDQLLRFLTMFDRAPQRADFLFAKMREAGIPLNRFKATRFIDVYGSVPGCWERVVDVASQTEGRLDTRLYNGILMACNNAPRSVELVESTLRDMQERGIDADAATVVIVLEQYRDYWEKQDEFMRSAQVRNVKWNERILAALVHSCIHVEGGVERAERLMAEFADEGVTADLGVKHMLLHLYGAAKMFDMQDMLLGELKVVEKDQKSFEILITTLDLDDRNVAINRATQLIEDMKRLGILPNRKTFLHLTRLFVLNGRSPELDELRSWFGGKLGTSFFNILLRQCAQDGDEEVARALLKEIDRLGLEPDWMTTDLLMKMYGRLGKVDEQMRVAKEEAVVDTSSFNIAFLSSRSILDQTERQEHVSNLLEVMRAREVKMDNQTVRALFLAFRDVHNDDWLEGLSALLFEHDIPGTSLQLLSGCPSTERGVEIAQKVLARDIERNDLNIFVVPRALILFKEAGRNDLVIQTVKYCMKNGPHGKIDPRLYEKLMFGYIPKEEVELLFEYAVFEGIPLTGKMLQMVFFHSHDDWERLDSLLTVHGEVLNNHCFTELFYSCGSRVGGLARLVGFAEMLLEREMTFSDVNLKTFHTALRVARSDEWTAELLGRVESIAKRALKAAPSNFELQRVLMLVQERKYMFQGTNSLSEDGDGTSLTVA